jgi:glycogen operon protein
MTHADWGSGFKCVAVFLNGDAIPAPNERGERVVDDSFLLCFNAHSEPVDFTMPDDEYAAEWTGEIDTTDVSGATQLVIKAGEKLSLQARSLLVLRKTA